MIRKLWLGIALYFRYMVGRSIRYRRKVYTKTTIAFGPHVLRYPDWKDKLKQLKAAGIDELHIYWTFQTPYNRLDVVSIPHVSDSQVEKIQYAKSLGFSITAQIRWNPTRESIRVPKDYPFWWWSGFVNLDGGEGSRFVILNEDLIVELKEKIQPNEIIIANESAQLIHLPASIWEELVDFVHANGMKATVALNTWQPLKMDPLVQMFTRGMHMEKAMRKLFSIIRLPYPNKVDMDFHMMMRPLPKWLAKLDSIGVNMYHYPTFNRKRGYSIRRVYAPMLSNITRIESAFRKCVTCTETGLELESGVDRSIGTATVWWRETFDFWFFGVRAKRVLVWEHDVEFFLAVVQRLGGLKQWLRQW